MLFVSPFPLSIGISSFSFFSTKLALVNEITPFALMRTLIFNSCGSPVGVGLIFLTYQRPKYVHKFIENEQKQYIRTMLILKNSKIEHIYKVRTMPVNPCVA